MLHQRALTEALSPENDNERREARGISRLRRPARRVFSRHWRSAGLFFRLLPLVVMPLDGKEHAGAEHGHLEHNKNYRDPIHLGDLPDC